MTRVTISSNQKKTNNGLVTPILILTRNNPERLFETVKALRERTLSPYKIYICDNQSSEAAAVKMLKSLREMGCTIIYNTSNRWVLGLNPGIKQVERDLGSPEFIAISDDDIIVPHAIDGVCWLTKLLQNMQESPYIGKLGLGLSLSNIDQRPDLQALCQEELKFKRRPLQDGIWSAAVDTTMALYRSDLFVSSKFRFYPGHNSYIRPYYHVGRLKAPFEAIHTGWNDYYKDRLPSYKVIRSKVLCFAIYAGYVHPVILAKCPLTIRAAYKILGPLFKALWGIRLYSCWILYILRCRIIYQNLLYRDIRKQLT